MRKPQCWIERLAMAGTLIALMSPGLWAAEARSGFAVATFEADITIPVGHACMGGGVADAREIVDPLWAKGFVLVRLPQATTPAGATRFLPIVVVALDWCQCNNDSYDRWRTVLAEAAGTEPRRVMLATVHQHDAPALAVVLFATLEHTASAGTFGPVRPEGLELRPGVS